METLKLPRPNFLLCHQVFLFLAGCFYPAPTEERLHGVYFVSRTPKSVAVAIASEAIAVRLAWLKHVHTLPPRGPTLSWPSKPREKPNGLLCVLPRREGAEGLLDCGSSNSFEITPGPLRVSSYNSLHQCGASLEFVKRKLIHMTWIWFPQMLGIKVGWLRRQSGMMINIWNATVTILYLLIWK